MKLFFLSMLVCFLTETSFSQTKIGFKAGVNLAKFAYAGDASELDVQTSFHIGGYVDLPVKRSLSVQPGLILSGKGSKIDFPFLKANVNIMYLEVPLNAVIRRRGFYLGGGPYGAVALVGKEEGEMDFGRATPNVEKFDRKIKFGKGEQGIRKRGDFGVNFLGGYQLQNGLNLGLNYGLGLKEISFKTTNRVVSATVGFAF